MLERVIENWLTNASELSFQLPFSYILASEGHTIIHITRHTPLEMGKDILTINKDNIPCAFQLKGGNINLRQWRESISGQVEDLVQNRINHPSIPNAVMHQSYLVTNGRIEEEVSIAIEQRNDAWENLGLPTLNVISGGELVRKAIDLKSELWPTELTKINSLLEFYLKEGNGNLDKNKLSILIKSTLKFAYKNGKAPSRASCYRSISSAALLTSLAIKSFKEKENHYAEIEAWVIYLAHVMSLTEKFNLSERKVQSDLNIGFFAIKNALERLIIELKNSENLTEGNPLVDHPFKKNRKLLLLSLLSIYHFWMAITEGENQFEDFISAFFEKYFNELELISESQIPQILAIYWYKRVHTATPEPDFFIKNIIEIISERNQTDSLVPLPNPYYEPRKIFPFILQNYLNQFLENKVSFSEEVLEDNFNGSSYTLEGLLELFARKNWRQETRFLWPKISKLSFESFEPKRDWQKYQWYSDEGTNITDVPNPTKSWSELRENATDESGDYLPKFLKKYPNFTLLFLVVYPHRFHKSFVKWLDSNLRNQ